MNSGHCSTSSGCSEILFPLRSDFLAMPGKRFPYSARRSRCGQLPAGEQSFPDSPRLGIGCLGPAGLRLCPDGPSDVRKFCSPNTWRPASADGRQGAEDQARDDRYREICASAIVWTSYSGTRRLHRDGLPVRRPRHATALRSFETVAGPARIGNSQFMAAAVTTVNPSLSPSGYAPAPWGLQPGVTRGGAAPSAVASAQ